MSQIDGKQLKLRSTPLDRLAKDIFAFQLASTFTVAGTTLADVTGFSFPLRAGSTYTFRFELQITSTAVLGSTVGVSVNYTGAVTRIAQNAILGNSATGASLQSNNANNTALIDNAARGSGGPRPTTLNGSITVSTAGTLTLRAQRSAATVTIIAGSFAEVQEI